MDSISLFSPLIVKSTVLPSDALLLIELEIPYTKQIMDIRINRDDTASDPH